MGTPKTEMIVNGERHRVHAPSGRSLLSLLREDLELTGAKPGCGEGMCGACTVLVDGRPVRACRTSASEVAGRSVTTIEGLTADGGLHPVQAAMIAEGAVQCGYCAPGIVMAAVALLEAEPRPNLGSIRAALEGNLCRCGGHARIERAIASAAAARVAETGEPRASCSSDSLPKTATFWERRPRSPWDLTPAQQRDYFELLGDGLVVVAEPPPPQPGQSTFGLGSLGAWLHVDIEGGVTAFTGKVELGQDNRSALSLLVAEELDVDVASVRLAMGDTDLCPFDFGTFGSRSMPDAGEALRRAAASARRLLAAEGPPRPGWRRLELAASDSSPESPTNWRRAGRPLARATARALVTGAHRFPTDLTRPGMLHGCVLWPPVAGARLTSVDLPAARVLATVVSDEGDPLAVAAESPSQARSALHALAAEWAIPPQPTEPQLEAHLRSHPIEVQGWGGAMSEEHGNPAAARAAADVQVVATYRTSYLSHVCLETRTALAEWEHGRLTVWTGTQQPFMVRHALAEALGIDQRDVRVLVPDLGGGFGSKHTEEVSIAAARLARRADRPVRVTLNREEEFRHSYMRPAAVIDVRSGALADGTITAWQHHDINAGAAAIRCPYRVENCSVSFQPTAAPLPQGPYRALAATANNFARESQIDELAAALSWDPLELRLHNLSDERLAAVLRAAADHAGWVTGAGASPDGEGIGIACGTEKGGRVATCVHVRWTGGGLEIIRVVTAYECGAIVNPDNVRRQVEGATVMGLGGALFEAIHFDGGQIVNASLETYRLPRFSDVPPIEVVLLDRPDQPSAGAGETPLIALAPALANAIVAAGGPRLRALPLLPAADELREPGARSRRPPAHVEPAAAARSSG